MVNLLKYKLKIKDIKLEDIRVYLFALFKGILPKKKIKNIEDLTLFVQKQSAWVSQVTLYNYLKTRMGTKWVLHFDDEVFLGVSIYIIMGMVSFLTYRESKNVKTITTLGKN